MASTHSFSVKVATRVGVDGAILLNHFKFWYTRNRAAGKNEREGRFWTYDSLKNLSALFPYWSPKQLRTALDKLEASGHIMTDYFGSDRTKWYSLSDESISLLGIAAADAPEEAPEAEELPAICPNGQMKDSPFARLGKCNCPNGQMDYDTSVHLPKRADSFAQTGKSICPNGQMPYMDTDSTTDSTTDRDKEPQNSFAVFEEVTVVDSVEENDPSSPPVAPPPSPPARRRSAPAKPKAETVATVPTVTSRIREIIEKNVDGYYWTTKDGAGAKQLAQKLKALTSAKKPDCTDEDIINNFLYILGRLPELPPFFQFTDVPKLNSNFNEIITQIRIPRTKPAGAGGKPVPPGHASAGEQLSRVANMFATIDRQTRRGDGGQP